jgi:indolepyruvate decarboxylase
MTGIITGVARSAGATPMPGGNRAGSVASYLVSRLEELGIEHLFNVAGSYCSGLLAELPKSPRLRAVFTTYEMEAAYAADAYARIKGYGAICGTYGVGALSALNGVAGAFVERCPVIVINGGPSAKQLQLQVEYGIMFLHSTGPLKTDLAVYSQVTVAAAVIDRAEDAPSKIDEVLIACMTHRRPVYLEISQDLWHQPCPLPAQPLSVPVEPVNRDALSECLTDAVARLAGARRALLWAGEELDRWGLQDHFAELVGVSGLPYVTTLAGKAVVAETMKEFLGVYDGRFASPDVQEIVEKADLVIALGTAITDFVGDIVAKDYGCMVLVSSGGVRIGHHVYADVKLRDFVAGLTERLRRPVVPASWASAARQQQIAVADRAEDTPLTFDLLFAHVSEFVRGKRVIADTGLSLFASAGLPISAPGAYISQSIWMSIGYSVGASVGAACASGQRPVVFVGDTAFREGPQAVSTLVQYKLPAVICVINNQIMGIQQFMGNPKYYQDSAAQPDYYNVLPPWNYGALAEAFGAHYAQAKTLGELKQALGQAAEVVDRPILIDVVLDPKDIPAVVRGAIGRGTPEAVHADFEGPLLRPATR